VQRPAVLPAGGYQFGDGSSSAAPLSVDVAWPRALGLRVPGRGVGIN
jgi:hypothetical protein